MCLSFQNMYHQSQKICLKGSCSLNCSLTMSVSKKSVEIFCRQTGGALGKASVLVCICYSSAATAKRSVWPEQCSLQGCVHDCPVTPAALLSWRSTGWCFIRSARGSHMCTQFGRTDVTSMIPCSKILSTSAFGLIYQRCICMSLLPWYSLSWSVSFIYTIAFLRALNTPKEYFRFKYQFLVLC